MSEETQVTSTGQEQTQDTGQSQSTDWRSNLSQEYRNKYTEFQKPEDFVKGYDSLVKKMGKDPLVKPSDDAPEEDKQKYNQKLRELNGVPDSPDKYEVNFSEDIPEAVRSVISDERLSNYKKIAQEEGIPAQAFDKFVNRYMQDVTQDLTTAKEAGLKTHEEAQAELKKEWGDKYDEKTGLANQFLKKTIPSSDQDAIIQKYGNDPLIIKTFASLAEKGGEVYDSENKGTQESVDSLEAQRSELTRKSVDSKLSIDERKRASKDAYEIAKKIRQIRG